jgi:hypothetical protein
MSVAIEINPKAISTASSERGATEHFEVEVGTAVSISTVAAFIAALVALTQI